MRKKFRREVEKQQDSLLKRTFKGETLEGYVEAAKCKTLEECEE